MLTTPADDSRSSWRRPRRTRCSILWMSLRSRPRCLHAQLALNERALFMRAAKAAAYAAHALRSGTGPRAAAGGLQHGSQRRRGGAPVDLSSRMARKRLAAGLLLGPRGSQSAAVQAEHLALQGDQPEGDDRCSGVRRQRAAASTAAAAAASPPGSPPQTRRLATGTSLEDPPAGPTGGPWPERRLGGAPGASAAIRRVGRSVGGNSTSLDSIKPAA